MKSVTLCIWHVLVVSSIAISAPPRPITDLEIQLVDSAHVRLDWSPVTQDTMGNPLDCVFYDIHRSPAADFLPSEATWIDSTIATTLTDTLIGEVGCYRIQVHGCTEVWEPEMVHVMAGDFMMQAHMVTLTHDYMLGRTELTNADFLYALNWAMAQGLVTVEGDLVRQYGEDLLRIGGPVDSYEIRYNTETQVFYLHAGSYNTGWGGPGFAYPSGYDPSNLPVKYLSWYGAACYCDWMSQMNGLPTYYNGEWSLTPIPNDPYAALGYRLPTEAEWQFAAQYDDDRLYPWGSAAPTCAHVNFYGSGYCVGWTSPVDSHPAGASALGLQDMAGNAEEWTNDWYAGFSNSPLVNPVGPATGSYRVTRGSNYSNRANFMTCHYRNSIPPSYTISAAMGFRLCRTTP